MNKFFTKIAAATLGVAMAIGVGIAVGHRSNAKVAKATTDAAYTFSDTSGTATSTKWSFTTAKNAGSTSPTYNSKSEELRLYPKNTITFTAATGYKLTSASFVCVVNANKSGTKPTGYSKDVGTLSTYSDEQESFTWTSDEGGNASFTVTINGSAGNIGLKTVAMSYEASSEEPTITVSTNEFSIATTDSTGNIVTASSEHIDNVSYAWSIVSGGSYVKLENADKSAVTIKPQGNSTGDAVVKVTASGTNGGNPVSKEKSVTVHVIKPNSVSETLAALDSSTPIQNVYTKGIISHIDSVDTTSSKGYADYYISDDGSRNNELYVYHGYSLGGVKFTAANEIVVGDSLTIFGEAKVYSETKEYNSYSSIIEIKHKPTISLTASSLNVTVSKSDNSVGVSTLYFSGAVTFTFERTGDDVLASYSVTDGKLNVTAKATTGTAHLKVIATYNTETANATIDITVSTVSGPVPSGRYFIHNGTASLQPKVYESQTNPEVANTAAKAWDFELVDTNKYQISTTISSVKYYLYCIADSRGLRTTTTAHTWTVTTYGNGYSLNSDDQTSRYVTYYSSNKDWRSRSYQSESEVQLTEEKDMYASNFLDTFTEGCIAEGGYTPANIDWTAANTQFGYLSSANQLVFKNATYTKTGSGSQTVVTPGEGVAQNVAEVVARYDLMVVKYTTSVFADFMNRTPSLGGGSRISSQINNSANIATIVIISISIVSIISLGALLVLRKKKEQ